MKVANELNTGWWTNNKIVPYVQPFNLGLGDVYLGVLNKRDWCASSFVIVSGAAEPARGTLHSEGVEGSRAASGAAKNQGDRASNPTVLGLKESRTAALSSACILLWRARCGVQLIRHFHASIETKLASGSASSGNCWPLAGDAR